MSKIFGILFGGAIAALGVWRFDATSSKIWWGIAVGVVTLLLLFVRRGQARRPALKLGIAVALIVCAFFATLTGTQRPQLGLDLQGGVSIVLFPVEGSDLSTLDTATTIIARRVASLGDPEVNRQGDTIVVDIPGLKDPERAMDLVGRTAELRFRVVTGGPAPIDAVAAPPDPTTTTVAGATTTVAGATTTTVAGTTGTTAAISPGSTTPTTPATTSAATDTTAQAAGRTITTEPIVATRPRQTPTTAGATTTTAVAGDTTATTLAGATTTTLAGDATTTVPPTATTLAPGTPLCTTLVGADDPAGTVWLWNKDKGGDDEATKAECYQVGPTVMTGRSIKTASARYDSGQGWTVDVEFRDDEFVQKVATPYVNQRVAIVLDDRVQSAPTINPGITGRNVTISGSFSEGEAKDLAQQLKYGALPIQFDENETTRQSVSPSLGKDQLAAGIAAGLIGLGLVAIYMLFFYRMLGLVVWIGLGLTGMVFFALVTFLGNADDFGLSLTLAGVTGLIVSVGVTVDSYVVYFERLKDEVRTGKTIRSSLDVGFTRAFRTIVAADVVSLIGAAVLYLLAIGSVKGFAFFLGLSTLIDLVIAYFVMHPLVWFMARRSALVRMRGMGIATGLDVAGRTDV